MFRFFWMLLIVMAVRSDSIDDIDDEDMAKTANLAAINEGISTDDYDFTALLRNGRDPKPESGLDQIKCYTCTDCKDLLMKTPTTLCPYSKDDEKMRKCITYVEKYNFLDKPWYVRGCASKIGSCSEIKVMHESMKDQKLTLKNCYECKGDLCNSVSRSLPLVFLIGAPTLVKLVL